MPKEHEELKKRLESERAAEEIRTDDFIKVTQVEADQNKDRLKNVAPYSRRRENHGRETFPRGIAWGVVALIIIFIGGSVFSFYAARKNIKNALSAQVMTLQAGVADLQNLDPQSAVQQFSSLNSATSSVKSGLFGAILSLFQGTGGLLQSLSDLSKQLTTLSQNLSLTENDLFGFVSGSGGNNFVADLTNIKTSLAAIDADTNQLSGAASYFGGESADGGNEYLALKTQVEGAETFLNAFIPWLSDTSTTHHILIVLENPSEMRPGGGFLGSYADVSLQGGAITNVSVHDIADVDAAFTQKIIPPVPLQLEETAWRPADGNWFFDFPTSASETLRMFQAPGLYANTSTTFDGVIAITPQVMSDLLSVAGPVAVGGPAAGNATTTFNSDNLVIQLQKIVQAKQAQQAKSSRATANFKTIIGALSTAIFQKLASSTDDQKQQLFGVALNWITNKDAMFYFNDPDFENFAEAYSATGNAYQLPENFNGDYLGIANADINSDKSELYVAQKVSFQANINTDGSVDDSVIINRTHNGNESPYWWYKTTNQDYLQLFVPDGSALTNESGGIEKSVPAPINYARNGYSTDPVIAAIASTTQNLFDYPNVSTHEEDGKEVFAVWSRVYAGKSIQLSFDYSHHLFAAPSTGMQYQFIFERQSGATGDYAFEINAPLGYAFAETGLSTYDYESTSTPGRLIINLTLQKL